MIVVKTIVRTLMFVVVVLFCVSTLHFYKIQANESLPTRPNFEHTNNQQFIDNVNQCIDYIYFYDKTVNKVDKDLLLAQAALESGWGNSRFARVGKNLFGIRTYDLQEPHMLPSNNPKKWGVKVFQHECDSVLHYINTLSNHHAYEKYRELLATGADSLELVETLDSYASDKDYFWKVKSIIKKIRENYKH
tara:strand:- start:1401 stop:1973 length:573 start_codon:yes stop_codon:yes gene_type:complete